VARARSTRALRRTQQRQPSEQRCALRTRASLTVNFAKLCRLREGAQGGVSGVGCYVNLAQQIHAQRAQRRQRLGLHVINRSRADERRDADRCVRALATAGEPAVHGLADVSHPSEERHSAQGKAAGADQREEKPVGGQDPGCKHRQREAEFAQREAARRHAQRRPDRVEQRARHASNRSARREQEARERDAHAHGERDHARDAKCMAPLEIPSEEPARGVAGQPLGVARSDGKATARTQPCALPGHLAGVEVQPPHDQRAAARRRARDRRRARNHLRAPRRLRREEQRSHTRREQHDSHRFGGRRPHEREDDANARREARERDRERRQLRAELQRAALRARAEQEAAHVGDGARSPAITARHALGGPVNAPLRAAHSRALREAVGQDSRHAHTQSGHSLSLQKIAVFGVWRRRRRKFLAQLFGMTTV